MASATWQAQKSTKSHESCHYHMAVFIWKPWQLSLPHGCVYMAPMMDSRDVINPTIESRINMAAIKWSQSLVFQSLHFYLHQSKIINVILSAMYFSNFCVSYSLHFFFCTQVVIANIHRLQWFVIYLLLTSKAIYVYIIRTVDNSWWWAQKMPETCKVLWQNKFWIFDVFSWLFYTKLVTMHGHLNIK